MKKVIAILLLAVLTLTLFAACKKDIVTELAGTWTVAGAEGEAGEQSYEAMQRFDASITFTFREDHTGTITLKAHDDVRETPITYTVESGKITVVTHADSGDGAPQSMDYRLENGRLFLTSDGATLIFTKQAR